MVKRDMAHKLRQAEIGLAAGRELLAATPVWRIFRRREYREITGRFQERVVCYSIVLGLIPVDADEVAT
jgi:hypothetical protein